MKTIDLYAKSQDVCTFATALPSVCINEHDDDSDPVWEQLQSDEQFRHQWNYVSRRLEVYAF